MTDAPDFRREQMRVALGMGVGFLVSLIALAVAASLDRAAAIQPFEARLPAFAQAEFFVVIWLALGIANVARMRFFSADDIAGSSSGKSSQRVENGRAVLQNTLEQVVLAVACHLLLFATVDRSTTIVTALAALFFTGRLLFWIGFRHGAAARAFGFALTFYPSLVSLLIVGTKLLSAGRLSLI